MLCIQSSSLHLCCLCCLRTLVQPTLTSALQGWGVSSLDQDAKDILQLTIFLKAEHSSQVLAAADFALCQYSFLKRCCQTQFFLLQQNSSHAMQAVILVGHSTGCQDAVRYAEMVEQKGSDAAPLAGIVLQAPVRKTIKSCKMCATCLSVACRYHQRLLKCYVCCILLDGLPLLPLLHNLPTADSNTLKCCICI